MKRFGRILFGVIVFIGCFIGSGMVDKQVNEKKKKINEIEAEIKRFVIPPAQEVYPLEELKSKIINEWLKKNEILDLQGTIEIPQEQEIKKIGSVVGERIMLKTECPQGLEKRVLSWIEEIKREYPVLCEEVKITSSEKGRNIEVGLRVFGKG